MTPDQKLLDGWQVLKFGEIAESISERVDDPSASGLDYYVGLEHLDPDTLRISRWGSPSDVGATKIRFCPGDVIYARRRAYQRKLGVAEWDGIASAHALVLRARPEVCLPEFLPYFLQSDQFHERALDISVGSLSPTINWKTLSVQEFVIPSLVDQWDAVAALSALDLVAELCSVATKQARELLQAVALREFRLVLPNDFVELSTVMALGPQNGLTVPKDERSGSICMINMGAMFGEELVVDAVSDDFVSIEPTQLARFQLREGDLLFARRSIVLEGAGRAVMVGEVGGPAVFESSIIRARPDSARLLPEYLLQYLHSPDGIAATRRIVRKGAVSGIAGSDLKRLPVPVPALEVQRRTVDPLRLVGETRRASQQHRSHCDALHVQLRESLLSGGG